ncbi:translation initiation factor IF-3 [Flavobacteriales bacterium]|nr:translation initiation factor IF-3 [Flavobacteriales bacterium]
MRPKKNNRGRRVFKEDAHKINDKILSREVRVVGDGIESAVYPISEALALATAQDLDLVEISPKAVPPVCKIIDYKKFLYEQKRKEKELKKNQSKVVVKEIRYGPNTDDHDFDFKLKHARAFLSEGAKVKAYVFFKGRTIVFKDRGEILLLKLAQEIDDLGVVEQMPQLMGKRMIMMINPKKK